MIIENVKMTSYGLYEDCDLDKLDWWSERDKKELKKAIKDNKLIEDLTILREIVIPIINNRGLELIITQDGFEFFNGDY